MKLLTFLIKIIFCIVLFDQIQASFLPDISAANYPTTSTRKSIATKNQPQAEPRKSSKAVLQLQQAKKLDASLQELQISNISNQDDIDFYFKNRRMWEDACLHLPMNRSIIYGVSQPQSGFMHFDRTKNQSIRNHEQVYDEFKLALDKVFELYSNGPLQHDHNWTSKGKPSSQFYQINLDGNKSIIPIFEPYIQKLDVAISDKTFFHGDIHGDIHALLNTLHNLEERAILQKDSFKLANPNYYLVFLGDYVDRGYYGTEVIYTLLRLKIANPDRVILIRGNHEDLNIDMKELYSFKDELVFKFGLHHKEIQLLLARLYNFFPLALYLGYDDNYIQCCHGGVEHGYQPANLLESNAQFDLLGKLMRRQSVEANDYAIGYLVASPQADGSYVYFDPQITEDFIPQGLFGLRAPSGKLKTKQPIGFAWFDFAKFGSSFWNPGRGLVADNVLTKAILDYQNQQSSKKVHAIFRAHQHAYQIDEKNPVNFMKELVENNGVFSLWQPQVETEFRFVYPGLVYTFNVSPDSVFGIGSNFTFDTFGILTVHKDYQRWILQVCNVPVVQQVTLSALQSSKRIVV